MGFRFFKLGMLCLHVIKHVPPTSFLMGKNKAKPPQASILISHLSLICLLTKCIYQRD